MRTAAAYRGVWLIAVVGRPRHDGLKLLTGTDSVFKDLLVTAGVRTGTLGTVGLPSRDALHGTLDRKRHTSWRNRIRCRNGRQCSNDSFAFPRSRGLTRPTQSEARLTHDASGGASWAFRV